MSRPSLERLCPRETDTIALGERVGTALVPGSLISLSGPLGAGKTVFVRGLATGAGVDPGIVRSPTFVLHHVYQGERLTLHHIDAYRLGPNADLTELDLDSLLEDGAAVVEWGEQCELTRFAPMVMSVTIVEAQHRLITLRDEGVPPPVRGAFADVAVRR